MPELEVQTEEEQNQREHEDAGFRMNDEGSLARAGFDTTLYRAKDELVARGLLLPIDQEGTALIPNPYKDIQHPSYIKSGPVFSQLTIAGNLRSTNYEALRRGWQLTQGGLIDANALRLTGTRYRNDDSIVYTGTWADESVHILIGGGRRVSTTVGDKFTITFIGDSIGLILEKSGNLGKFNVTIDGVNEGDVDLYDTNLSTRSVVYTKTGLHQGRHELIGTVVTKNASSSGNGVGLQAYILSPFDGVKLEYLDADILVSGFNTTTNANGYVTSTNTGMPAGREMWWVEAFYLDTTHMDTTATKPMTAHKANAFYIYGGAASTTYTNNRAITLSKLLT